MAIHTQSRNSTAVKTSLDQTQVEQLRTEFRGRLIQAGDPAYEEARKIYNGMIDKRPALIARCRDTADVISAVRFSHDQDLPVAVRAGGHHAAGLSLVEDGLVIDLSLMKGIHLDPKAGSVRVQPGCTLGDMDHATNTLGMAVPSGFVSTTGISGLTLGGGVGYLSRAYGLTIDNLLEADLVLADGRFVIANREENEDLFWAIRGGGGNFGVVTSLQFKLNPVNVVYGGPMLWPIEKSARIMKFWRDYILQAPENINGWFGFFTVPPIDMFPKEHHLKKACALVWCYTGDMSKAEQVFKPIREFEPPLIDFAGPIPFPALQSLFDGLLPPGLQWYWRADFVKDLSDEAINVHTKYGNQLPTMISTMHLYPINGAAHKLGSHETAWSYRDANFVQIIGAVDSEPTNNERMIQWAKDYWQAAHPYSMGGGYLNLMWEEGQERIQESFRDNYPRLAEIKKKYDPTNFFRSNQNIKPKA